MKCSRSMAVLFSVFLMSGVAMAQEDGDAGNDVYGDSGGDADWAASTALEGDLAKALQAMITTLEEQRYKDFLENHVDPEDKAKVLQSGKTMDELAEGFGKNKAGTLLQVLQSLKNKIPSYDSKGMMASFTFDDKGSQIRFHKVGENWYMKN